MLNNWRHPHSHGGESFAGYQIVVLLGLLCAIVWNEITPGFYNSINPSIYTDRIYSDAALRMD